jgi:hypothetical protein
MGMKTTGKDFIFGFLSAIMFILIIIFVFSAIHTITLVRYKGESVTPIIFDATTYISTRVISESIGQPVNYNTTKNSLEIGTIKVLKRSDFDSIRPGMTITEVEALVGQATIFLTSGLHQVGYALDDGTTIGLYYIPGENHIETLKELFLINKDGSRITLLSK